MKLIEILECVEREIESYKFDNNERRNKDFVIKVKRIFMEYNKEFFDKKLIGIDNYQKFLTDKLYELSDVYYETDDEKNFIRINPNFEFKYNSLEIIITLFLECKEYLLTKLKNYLKNSELNKKQISLIDLYDIQKGKYIRLNIYLTKQRIKFYEKMKELKLYFAFQKNEKKVNEITLITFDKNGKIRPLKELKKNLKDELAKVLKKPENLYQFLNGFKKAIDKAIVTSGL